MLCRHWLSLLVLAGMLGLVCRATATTPLQQANNDQQQQEEESFTGLFAACPCRQWGGYLEQAVAVDSSYTQTLWHVCLVVYEKNHHANNHVVLLGIQDLVIEYRQEQDGLSALPSFVRLVQDPNVTCRDNYCVVQATVVQDKQELAKQEESILFLQDLQEDYSRNGAMIIMTGNATATLDDADNGTATRKTTAFSVSLVSNTTNTTSDDACLHEQHENEESSGNDVLVLKGMGMVIFILVAIVIICCCYGTKIPSTTTRTATTSDIQVV